MENKTVELKSPSDISEEDAKMLNDLHKEPPLGAWSSRASAGAPADPFGNEVFGRLKDSSQFVSPRPREAMREPEPQELEDLYALHPKFGGGEVDMKCRVTRITPKIWKGQNVQGTLGEFRNPIDVEQFAKRFGGGTFSCKMMAATESGSGDAAGYRSLEPIVRVKIPGAPKVIGGDDEEHEVNRGYQTVGMHLPPRDPPEIRLKQIEYDREDRKEERLREEQMRRELDSMRREQDKIYGGGITALREEHRLQIEHMQNQLERSYEERREAEQRAADEKREYEKRLFDMQQEIVNVRSEAARAINTHETERLRQQKDVHETELRRIERDYKERYETQAERHRQEVAAQNERHREEISNLTSRHTEERRNYESAAQQERERIHREFTSRMDDMRHMQERDDRMMRESRERDDRFAKERFDRELAVIRESAETRLSSNRESTEMREVLLRDELERERSHRAQLEAENRSLRDKLHKPTEEALLEARQIASMTGMIDASDAKGDETITGQLLNFGKSLAESGPEIIKQLKAKGMQVPGFTPPMYHQMPPQYRPMPPQMAAPVHQQAVAHPHAQVQAQVAHAQPQPPRHAQAAPGMRPATVHEPKEPEGQDEEKEAPLQGDYSTRVIGDGMADEGEEDEQQVQQLQLDGKLVGHVVNSISAAIVEQKEPATYADELIGAFGKDALAPIVSNLTADQLIGIVMQVPGADTTPVVSRDGKLYVKAVFEVLKTQLLTTSS